MKRFWVTWGAVLFIALMFIPFGHYLDERARAGSWTAQLGQMAPPAPPPPVTESPEIAKLRDEAHQRGIAWMIYCDDDLFAGLATLRGKNNCISEDDPRGNCAPWWNLHHDYPTEEAVAAALLKLIRKPPNVYPEPATGKHKRAKECPAPIMGD